MVNGVIYKVLLQIVNAKKYFKPLCKYPAETFNLVPLLPSKLVHKIKTFLLISLNA